jgi:transcriptional regulator with XRE-family HTH domain
MLVSQPSDTPALGERLKMLRHSRALTLEELAGAAGALVSRQAISKYERGLMLPSPRVLRSLAGALGVRVSELLAPPGIKVEILAFRKMSRFPRKELQRVQSLVARMLEHRVTLEQVSGSAATGLDEIPFCQYRVSSLDECESAATSLREVWGLGVDPISSMTDVLEEHRIHVLEIESERTLDGLSAIARDDVGRVRAAAVVSRSGLPGERQRLSLAHELGHLVLEETPTVDGERAAFRFGAAFLAPAVQVRRDVGDMRRRVSLQELLLLKRRYGISVQALVFRLRDLGIITEPCATGLWKQISARGWRQAEPETLEAETPQWARRAAHRAIAEGSLTIDEAERLLGITSGAARHDEETQCRDLMRLPIRERKRRLSADADRSRSDYTADQEWRTLLGGDLLPGE